MNPGVLAYNTGLVLGAVATSPFWALLLASKPKHRAGFLQKLIGRPPVRGDSRPESIWYHAVSVGEVMASLPLIQEILRSLPQHPLWITTVTATGQAVARARVEGGAGVFYLPYDLPWVLDRVIRRLRPRLFVTAETEIWPNLIWRLHRHGIPVALVNGRISDRSFPWYRRFRPLFRRVLSCVDLLCMESEESARRIMAMGARPERVRVTGNLKFDQPIPHFVDEQEWRRRLGLAPSSAVWVAGSTHPGEEEMVLRVFARLTGRREGLQLVLAPRAPERFGEVETLISRMNLSGRRRSGVVPGGESKPTQVVLLDTIGELAQVYGIAHVAFVGGSLAPRGGHNPLEVAAHGRPVLFGPHMENFRQISVLLRSAGGAWEVDGEETLEAKILEILARPDLAREMGQSGLKVMRSQRGAAARALALLTPLLERRPWV